MADNFQMGMDPSQQNPLSSSEIPHQAPQATPPQENEHPSTGTPNNMPQPPETPSEEMPTPQASLQQSLLVAIEAHFVAKRSKAIANLNNYMLNPAAIGEHPDVVAESIKLIEDISEVDGCIQTIRRVTK